MPDYLVHVFDSGHVNATYRIAAESDADAIEKAKAIVRANHDVQIWQGRRFVAKLGPLP